MGKIKCIVDYILKEVEVSQIARNCRLYKKWRL